MARTLALIGAGAMGEALLRGLLAAQVFEAAQVTVCDADVARLQTVCEALGTRASSDVTTAVRGADAVLLAVKPQVVEAVLLPLRGVLTSAQTLLSIAAGVSLARLQELLAAPVPAVRVMPNTPVLVGAGATAFALGTHAGTASRALAEEIFGAVGEVLCVEEKLLDAVTGLSGSGPAYVFLFIEALSDAGVKMGLPREVSTRLAAQTVLGSARMVLETGQHPGALKDQVTSPGGTTIAGLHALEKRAFRAAAYDAVEAATRRARELIAP